MYNSVLDLNFNTIKPILYCYGIIQYLILVQHSLLSCDNYVFLLVTIQAFQHSFWLHVISFKHNYQTIKWLFKICFCIGASQPKKRESKLSTNSFQESVKYILLKDVPFYLLSVTHNSN